MLAPFVKGNIALKYFRRSRENSGTCGFFVPHWILKAINTSYAHFTPVYKTLCCYQEVLQHFAVSSTHSDGGSEGVWTTEKLFLKGKLILHRGAFPSRCGDADSLHGVRTSLAFSCVSVYLLLT